MVKRWLSRVEAWGEYIAYPKPKKAPQQPGKIAKRLDYFGRQVVIFLGTLIIWLMMGISLFWSIIAALVSIGLAARFLRSPRRIKLLSRGTVLLKSIKGHPEATPLNQRFWVLLGVGSALLVLAGIGGGSRAWYWGSLGAVNIGLSLLVLWQRRRLTSQQV